MRRRRSSSLDFYTLKEERALSECIFNVLWHILGLLTIVGFGVAFLIAFC